MLRDSLEALAGVLRDDIGAALASDGVDCQIEPRFVRSPSESPCIDMYAGPRSGLSAAFGDISGSYVINVRTRVTTADNESAQDILTDLADDQNAICVAAALESDPTLNGWVSSLVVDPDSFSGIQDFSYPGQEMLGFTWRVLIEQAFS